MAKASPSFTKRILNKLFFRHLIAETHYDVKSLHKKAAAQRERTELLNLTGEIIEKKVDHLSQKIDAYSEFEDEIRQRFADMLQQLQSSVEGANGLTLELKEQIAAAAATSEEGHVRMDEMRRSLDALDGANDTLSALREDAAAARLILDALDSRLSALQTETKGNAGRIGAIAETLKTANDQNRLRHEALDAKLSAVQSERNDDRFGEIAQAVEQIRTRQETLDARLSAIQAHSELASAKVDTFSKTVSDNIVCITASVSEDAKENLQELKKDLHATALNEYTQVEALLALTRLIDIKKPLRPLRRSAASPDFLLKLYHHVVDEKPKCLVELGSGVSTVVIAAALRQNGFGKLYSLDHEQLFANITRNDLDENDLADYAQVYEAPLAPWRTKKASKLGTEWQWYDVPEEVRKVDRIDLLFVDGPPEGASSYARYPAVPQFLSQMDPGCVIFLDDARRTDETAIAKAWSKEFKLDLSTRLLGEATPEKGLAVLELPSGLRTA